MLVGPDNGLLAPAVAMVGGADRAVSLTDTDHHLDSPGTTFDGRDVFAPVAAHICNGVDLADLGEVLDPGSLVPGVVPVSVQEPDGLHAEVLWVDTFGNVQLNVDPADLPGNRLQVRIGEQVRTAQIVTAFDQVPSGGLGLLVDSAGLVSLVVARASAAVELGIAAGTAVVLADIDRAEAGAAITVQLGRSRAG